MIAVVKCEMMRTQSREELFRWREKEALRMFSNSSSQP